MPRPAPSNAALRAALLAAASAWLCAPAQAQWFDRPVPFGYNAPPQPYGYGYGYGGGPRYGRALRPDEVQDRLEEQGFEDVGRPRFGGGTYEVLATSPRGIRVRLVIDAYRGAILERTGLGRGGEFEDSVAPRGAREGRFGAPSPYDEMPNAPRIVPPGGPEPRALARRNDAPITAVPLAPPGDPRLAPDRAPAARAPRAPAPERREASRPDDAPVAALPAPADPRLAPGGDAPAIAPPGVPKPRRAAARPSPSDSGSQGLYGTNPGAASGAAKPAARPAKPPADAARAAPAAPPAATAQAADPPASPERKPVRVIQGVTPMNSGGQQSSPAPQNGVDGSPKPAP